MLQNNLSDCKLFAFYLRSSKVEVEEVVCATTMAVLDESVKSTNIEFVRIT